MVIGTLIGIIVFFFFNLQIPINDYIINQYNLTNEEDYQLHKQQPFRIEKRGGAFYE